MPAYYPVMLALEGHLVVVVGGGAVAARKVTDLLEAGAVVRVVAAEISSELVALRDAGHIKARLGSFNVDDLEGARIAVAATSDSTVNRKVVEEARKRGIWVNVVDDPDRCDFIVPATIRRGPMLIAVTTGGRSPAMARWARQRIEEAIEPGVADVVDIIGNVRAEIMAEGGHSSPEQWQRAIVAALEALRSGQTRQTTIKIIRQELTENHSE